MATASGQTIGKSSRIWVDQTNVSGDLNDVTTSVAADTPEKTTFIDIAHTMFTGGLRTWGVNWAGLFNDTTTAGSVGLETMLNNIRAGGSGIVASFWHGHSACNVGYEGPAVLASYEFPTPVAEAVTATAAWTGSVYIARTQSLSGCLTDTGSTAASVSTCGINLGGSMTGTLRAFLRVPLASATTAGSMTVTIQDSADDTTYTDSASFTTLDLVGTGCAILTASQSTASQYVRAQYAIGGATGSDAAVSFLISAGMEL